MKRWLLCALLCLFTTFSAISPIRAEDNASDRETLGLYYEPHDLEIAVATRSPRPLSHSAENITVITADDIERLNAHTLAEVLNTVAGVQVDLRGAPSIGATFELAGATSRHILVLIDGVTINDQLDNIAFTGQIPVQNIERVEIVKGPASSAWGSALGGVVNVVTKEPQKGSRFGGAAYFSGGERGTRDGRGELSGTMGSLGYYLAGGNLRGDGFRPFNASERSDLYAKLRWDIPENRGTVRLTLNYQKIGVEEGLFTWRDATSRLTNRQLFSTLSLDYALSDRLTLSGTLKGSRLDYNRNESLISTGEPSAFISNDEITVGGATLLTWRQGLHTVTGGVEYDHGKSDTSVSYPAWPDYNSAFSVRNDKWGLFLNDTIVWGPFALTPAVRYDLTSATGDHFSPSIGAAYSLTDKTILRAFAAKGYSLPRLRPEFRTPEKGWSIQGGLETSEIPFLWLRGTWFRSTAEDPTDRTVREGVEVEARTVPLFNTWLTAGYVFTDATSRSTNTEIPGVARDRWDLGLHYDDRTIRGALTGHYAWWNTPGDWGGKYKNFIWDLNLGWRLYRDRTTETEIFFTGHNLFNGRQYPDETFINPSRWFEGGLRITW
ncbi:TonB-dependent receptor plug domain-containing protein [Geobacter pickeringii]|uniref:TonB-dependent receptor plug domain-containing protein n=1 Tax=Geobacter pickeringii TaxID=345632 RepID=UPI000AC06969|nr:TonB-dependent receptor [Geobacter pickeringii]